MPFDKFGSSLDFFSFFLDHLSVGLFSGCSVGFRISLHSPYTHYLYDLLEDHLRWSVLQLSSTLVLSMDDKGTPNVKYKHFRHSGPDVSLLVVLFFFSAAWDRILPDGERNLLCLKRGMNCSPLCFLLTWESLARKQPAAEETCFLCYISGEQMGHNTQSVRLAPSQNEGFKSVLTRFSCPIFFKTFKELTGPKNR